MCEESTKDFNGQQIFCRHWKPATDNPKCLVFICHGFGEHCGRYDELVALLNKENIYVFSHDHVGHGKSSGYRAWVDSYDAYCGPVKMHIEETAARYHGKKVFIYAHSMGGLISSRLMELFPSFVNGLVMEAPFLGVPDFVPSWQVSMGCFIGRYVGSLPVSKVDVNGLTRVSSVVEDYENDPLVFHGMANAKFVKESMAAKDEVFAKAKSLVVPLLICHGDSDRICPISGSETLYNKAGSTDKTYKVFEGGYHQLHTEIDEVKTAFFKLVLEWIHTRC